MGKCHFPRKFLFIGQRKFVLRREHFVGKSFEGVVGHGFVLLGAKDEAHGRVLIGSDVVAAFWARNFGEHGGLVAREGRALIELGADLTRELAD